MANKTYILDTKWSGRMASHRCKKEKCTSSTHRAKELQVEWKRQDCLSFKDHFECPKEATQERTRSSLLRDTLHSMRKAHSESYSIWDRWLNPLKDKAYFLYLPIMSLRIHAHVRTDKLEIVELDTFKKFLSQRVGDLITLDLEKVYSKRTPQENKYYHGVVIPILADYWWYDIRIKEEIEAVKDILYEEHLTSRIRLSRDKRRKFSITRRSSDLNTKEFEKFMEDVRIWARLKFNVIIPEPNEEIQI